MNTTSRRNFITGLATTAVTAPLAASTVPSNDTTTPTFEQLKPGLQYAIKGYLMQWAYYDTLSRQHLNSIESDVNCMLLPLKVEGIIHDFEVVASVEKNRPKIVIYLKVESSVNLKIWSCHLISEPACQFLDNVKEYS